MQNRLTESFPSKSARYESCFRNGTDLLKSSIHAKTMFFSNPVLCAISACDTMAVSTNAIFNFLLHAFGKCRVFIVVLLTKFTSLRYFRNLNAFIFCCWNKINTYIYVRGLRRELCDIKTYAHSCLSRERKMCLLSFFRAM